MTTAELAALIRRTVADICPCAVVEIVADRDAAKDLSVNIYSVPRELVRTVKDAVLELNLTAFDPGLFIVTPIVRDEETTRKFYPWRCTSAEPADAFSGLGRGEFFAAWIQLRVPTSDVSFFSEDMAANEELALAS